MRTRSLAVTALFLVAGCSGGGGGSAAEPAPVPTPTPTATPGPSGQHQYAKVTFSFHPRAKSGARSPHYISPFSTTFGYTILTVNGSSTIPSWVTSPGTTALVVGSNCTLSGGTESCTVSVPAPVGSVEYQFEITDGTNVLSANQVTETVLQGQNNTFPTLTLEGLVNTVTVSGIVLAPHSTSGTYRADLNVLALDADSNVIVLPGAYANPITLTDPETATSGQTMLSLNGGSPSGSVIVSSPNDTVSLVYTGKAINSFAIAASGSIPGGGTIACKSVSTCTIVSATPNDITFSGTTLDDTAQGGLNTDLNYNQQTVFFSQASGSQNIGAAEVGFTGSTYAGSFDVTLDPSCAGIASVSAGPATSFKVTALGTAGLCKAKLSEDGSGYPLTNPGHTPNTVGTATHDGTFWISVTTSSIGVNGKSRR